MGISKSGVFVFQQEHEMDVLMDYCIYDYYQGGINAVSRYIMEHPQPNGSDEHIVLKAMSEAFYSIVQVEDVMRGVGVRAHDLLQDKRFLLVDIGLSKTALTGFTIAARLIPFEDFVMTSGTALPLDADMLIRISDLLIQQSVRGPKQLAYFSVKQRADLSGSIIRICLQADASSRIAYKDIEKNPNIIPFPAVNNRIGRNDPCPCGSGRKYKHCCGQ